MNFSGTHNKILIGCSFLLSGFLSGCGSSSDSGSAASHQSLSSFSSQSSLASSQASSAATVTRENSGADCAIPALDDFAALTVIAGLPDPFLSLDGTRITRKSDWRCRRAEIAAQAQVYELGEKPSAPQTVSGNINGDSLRVTIEENGKTIEFDAQIILPKTGSAPYPAVIGIGQSFLQNDELLSRGVALINFPNNALAEQVNGASRGKGSFYDIYGSDHSAGAMMAWAWGVSRLIDALESTDGSQINPARLGVTGCSRNGKGALIAGAFDERIALTIPQESGSGGAASWRVSDAQVAAGQNVQTLRQIVTENVWLAEDFARFSESATKLPFDHHSIMAMVAPRGLLVIENTSMEWLGNESTYTASLAAREIFTAMGIADRMGISQIGDHGHCQLPDSQVPELRAFVDKFLLDNAEADTQVVKTDGEFSVDRERWIEWETPVLQ